MKTKTSSFTQICTGPMDKVDLPPLPGGLKYPDYIYSLKGYETRFAETYYRICERVVAEEKLIKDRKEAHAACLEIAKKFK